MGTLRFWCGRKVDGLRRFGEILKAKFKFFRNGSYLRKPLIVVGSECLSIGKGVHVDAGCRLQCYPTKNGATQLVLSDHVFIGFRCTLISAGRLLIGQYAILASEVFITNENHGHDPEGGYYMKQELLTRDVIIGDHCWIGEKVSILPGVCIGKWSIIGANSVVTKSIPDYSIAVGNPARVIKRYSFEKHMWVSCRGEE